MPIRRHFIDWTVPALPAAVQQLVADAQRAGFCDLSGLVVVTPGGRSGRRFLELLAELTDGRNAPPRMLTPNDLPELLYRPRQPFADDLTQSLAWVESLRGAPSDRIRRLTSDPPDPADLPGWLAIARRLAALHRDLAGDRLDFGDVAESPLVKSAAEGARWQSLRELQRDYLTRLDALGLWDKQTARLIAVQKQECRTDLQIFLIGAVDMNRTLRAMLAQVGNAVTAFVHAPASLAARFDDDGVLRPDAWETAELDLPDSMLRFVDGPDEQAAAVIDELARLGDRFAADEVLIGLADEAAGPLVRQELAEQELPTRWVGSRRLDETPPLTLLAAMAQRLEDDRTSTMTRLVRHPDVGDWLNRLEIPADWLTTIDELVSQRIPRRLGRGTRWRHGDSTAQRVVAAVDRWLLPLSGAARPLGEWSGPLLESLQAIYGEHEFDTQKPVDREISLAIAAIRDVLTAQADVPRDIAPSTTAAAAIRLALEALSGQFVPPLANPRAVEMVGWLELPLDDAPALIVCGFNEGFVPSSLNGDMFLPNRLREELGLPDNRRRFARDAYATSVLGHSRPFVKLIAARRDIAGDPLSPSRLMFATDAATIARRVKQAFARNAAPVALSGPRGADTMGFRVPRVRADISPPVSLSVTAFKDYLTCRYRYYLKHVERLNSIDDRLEELDGRTYGSLLHFVLARFAAGPQARSGDPDAIARELDFWLKTAVSEQLDPDPQPAVLLQIEQARLRLRGFADWQAQRTLAGWEIYAAERSAEFLLSLSDGRSVWVKGRIDRIDYHSGDNVWAVLDYKTGDAGKLPGAAHLLHDEWIDLQLPLYRRLAQSLDLPAKVQLGYILLPKSPEGIREALATWTDEQLEFADNRIRETAAQILSGAFWPPAREAPEFDDFGSICQEGVFGREIFE